MGLEALWKTVQKFEGMSSSLEVQHVCHGIAVIHMTGWDVNMASAACSPTSACWPGSLLWVLTRSTDFNLMPLMPTREFSGVWFS